MVEVFIDIFELSIIMSSSSFFANQDAGLCNSSVPVKLSNKN